MHVIYGSQTGQSKSIAEGICSSAAEKGFNLKPISFENLEGFSGIDIAFLIVSTTGDGDIPDNCLKFMRKLRKQQPGCLSALKYALLALGDTNYTNFCGGGKAVDALLVSKGASHIFDTVYADDAVGQENEVEEFCEKIWKFLGETSKPELEGISNEMNKVDLDKSQQLQNESNSLLSVFDKSFSYSCGEHRPRDNKNSFKPPEELKLPTTPKDSLALKFLNLPTQPQGDVSYFGMASEMQYFKIKDIRKLSWNPSSKRTLQVTVEGVFNYQPGDSFSTVLPNDPNLVDMLLKRLNVGHLADIPCKREMLIGSSKPESAFAHIPHITTLRYVFSYCLDFASMPFKKAFYRLLADYTSNDSEYEMLLELSSRQGSEAHNKMRGEMVTLMDVLHIFKHCNPPVERVIENLPVLLPRPYSFASSPLSDKNEFSFVFNVVEIKEQFYRLPRKGVATGWFDSHLEIFEDSCRYREVRIPVFLRSNTSFRMPEDPLVPLILIGPGTGVAPFIGFLRHREALLKQDESVKFGQVYLLFGCRTEKHDFLFESELKQFHEQGVLTELLTCFSRDEDSEFKYVQDILRHQYEKFGALIMERKANVYICGDAANMAKDVNEALIEVVEKFLGVSNSEARGTIVKLRTDPKQIKEDVWT